MRQQTSSVSWPSPLAWFQEGRHNMLTRNAKYLNPRTEVLYEKTWMCLGVGVMMLFYILKASQPELLLTISIRG